MNASLRSAINHLPHRPGVYLFSNAKGDVLYVGKSSKLKARVSSYFHRTADLTPAKREMVREITSLATIVTPSEAEALILEATLIKRHQPPYNVILKDDRDFLYVRIDLTEAFPPVQFVRRPTFRRGRRVFGPYTSAVAIRQSLRLLKKIFPYRTCKQGPADPCFDSRLGRCAGHGLDSDSRARYRVILSGVIDFLEGRTEQVLATARKLMDDAARERRFELAAKLRDQLQSLERVSFRQIVIGQAGDSQDVVGFDRQTHWVGVAVVRVRGGRIIDSRTFLLTARANEGLTVIAAEFLDQYYASTEDRPKELLLRLPPAEAPAVVRDGTRLVVVHRGRRLGLVRMAEENAQHFLERKRSEALTSEQRGRRGIEDLMQRLHLKTLPQRIETYDISNIQGTNAVGSLVVFTAGVPAKQWYRKFSIKSVRGSDDFKMMAEVLTRRLRNVEWPAPDLVVLDGGKGQLSAVRTVFDARGTRWPLVSLAKRDEEVFRPGQKESLKLPPHSEALLLLRHMRDEAHRFAIGFYRGKHRQETVQSALDTVPGIGPKYKKLLLLTFGSVRGIREADDSQITKLIGPKRLTLLREHL